MATKSMIEKDKILEMYKMMVKIREFEKQGLELAKQNKFRAVIHTYIGQEAVAVGVCSALKNDDVITSTHRGHGHCIAKGADLRKMYAELMGKKTGYCDGKGGSMHIADVKTGNLGANGIVGGGIPIAMGAGLGFYLDNSEKVSVCFFGDGASNQGSFHEALNMASIWDLPVIFVCENNKYAISTHYKNAVNIESIAERAKAYGIPGIKIDGNNVVEVYKTIIENIDSIRNGSGPILIEADTYRLRGHYYGDMQNYRERSEVKYWKEKDPLKICREILRKVYDIDEEVFEQIKKEEKTNIKKAVSQAESDPEPEVKDLLKDLFTEKTANIKWIGRK